MPASLGQVAKRAFVKILLELAALYGLAPNVNRDSTPQQLESAFKRASLKVHPDKGGKRAHFQKLQSAREAWKKAQPASSSTPGQAGPQSMACGTAASKGGAWEHGQCMSV